MWISNIKSTLQKMVAREIEGKCIIEGFIKPNSTKIISYSNGLVQGDIINFEVIVECLVCNPVEGMIIPCMVKDITRAGIRAVIKDDIETISNFLLLVIIIIWQTNFSAIKENEEIRVKVIGQRFELNDKYISVIAELVDTKETLMASKKKPKLVIK